MVQVKGSGHGLTSMLRDERRSDRFSAPHARPLAARPAPVSIPRRAASPNYHISRPIPTKIFSMQLSQMYLKHVRSLSPLAARHSPLAVAPGQKRLLYKSPLVCYAATVL